MGDSVRTLQPRNETMKRYYGDIERLIYAAEILCPVKERDSVQVIGQVLDSSQCDGCPFQDYLEELTGEKQDFFECRLLFLRRWIGNPVVQHDCKVIP